MKADELAFFNQQLAVMLREGIPLEGGISRLVADMRDGPLRQELDQLRADLEKGTPFNEAVARRKLPVFYTRMLTAGAAAQDLPAMLTLLADYYHRAQATWARVKGLMVYPLIVILVALGLSATVAVLLNRILLLQTETFFFQVDRLWLLHASLWASPVIIAVAAAALVIALALPSVRSWARWRLPAFREASLSQLASAMALMLRKGVALSSALELAEALETGTPVEPALRAWRHRISSGQGRMADWQPPGKILPPLFTWLVKSSGDDLAGGFQKAADLYATRSAYRTDLLLYGLLPVSILLLGQMIIWQIVPAASFFVRMMNALGDMGGM